MVYQMFRVVVWSTGTAGRHAIAGIDRDAEVNLWQPGIISMAWGPLVYQIAAGRRLIAS